MSIVGCMPPALPIEIWERVINYLWTDAVALAACSLVCKAWRARCRYHLITSVDLVDRQRTQWLIRLLNEDPGLRAMVVHVAIYGTFRAGRTTQGPVPHLASFAAGLAKKLPCMKILDLRHAEVAATPLHRLSFVHLSCFTSITTLYLSRVTFSSKPLCARLLCALSNLEQLACEDVLFSSSKVDPSVLPPAVPRVKTLWMDGHSDDVVDLITSELGLAKVMEDVRIGDSPHVLHPPSGRSVMSLLQHAGPSLKQLMIQLRAPPSIKKPHDGAVSKGATASVRPSSYLLESEGSWLSVGHCTILERLIVGCRLPMSTAQGPDSYRNVYSAWLCSLLASTTSQKLSMLVIILDVRLIRYTGASHLLDRAIEFLEQQDSTQMNRLLIGPRFQSLKRVCIHLLCGIEAIPPDHIQWESLVSSHFPKLCESNILQ